MAAGLAGSIALTRLLRTVLFEVEATDPVTFAAVGAGTLAVALLACFLPARRAAATDPAGTLREE